MNSSLAFSRALGNKVSNFISVHLRRTLHSSKPTALPITIMAEKLAPAELMKNASQETAPRFGDGGDRRRGTCSCNCSPHMLSSCLTPRVLAPTKQGSKVTIVGVGSVGMACAFGMLQKVSLLEHTKSTEIGRAHV